MRVQPDNYIADEVLTVKAAFDGKSLPVAIPGVTSKFDWEPDFLSRYGGRAASEYICQLYDEDRIASAGAYISLLFESKWNKLYEALSLEDIFRNINIFDIGSSGVLSTKSSNGKDVSSETSGGTTEKTTTGGFKDTEKNKEERNLSNSSSTSDTEETEGTGSTDNNVFGFNSGSAVGSNTNASKDNSKTTSSSSTGGTDSGTIENEREFVHELQDQKEQSTTNNMVDKTLDKTTYDDEKRAETYNKQMVGYDFRRGSKIDDVLKILKNPSLYNYIEAIYQDIASVVAADVFV